MITKILDWLKRYRTKAIPVGKIGALYPYIFDHPQSERDYHTWCYKNDKCPNCWESIRENWLEGPTGGLSTNMACKHCLARWNLTLIEFGSVPGDPMVIIDRTGDVTREEIGR